MKKYKQILLILGGVFLLNWPVSQSQVTIGHSTSPNSGAILQLKENDNSGVNSSKGLLLPRVALSQTNSMSPIIENATATDQEQHIGLTVYHIGSLNLCAGVYVWDGIWNSIVPCYATVNCSSANFSGTYKVGTPLEGADNTLSINITVPESMTSGTYSIHTNVVNGISFSANGSLVQGTNTIILAGAGTPQSGGVDNTFTIIFEYSNGSSNPATCTAVLPSLPIGKAKISGFGLNNNVYGYYAGRTDVGSRLFLEHNFGTSNTLYEGDGFEYLSPLVVDGLTPANFTQTATWQANPDILINGYYSYTTSTPVVDSLMAYLDRGGVLIMFDEFGNGAYNTANITYQICQRLFPSSTIGFSTGGTPGAVSSIQANVDDEISNGPFGPIQGLTWGHDASVTVAFTGLPQDSIIVYSTGEYIDPASGQLNGNQSAVTMFRHKRLNFFFCGDGGFLSNPNYGTTGSEPIVNNTICPLAVRATDYYPIPRVRWGYNSSYTVYNSQIFANIMDWAMHNAKSNK